VAGERVKVDTLIPTGVDPHAYEPVPQDVAKIVNCSVLIVNGAGLEEKLAAKDPGQRRRKPPAARSFGRAGEAACRDLAR